LHHKEGIKWTIDANPRPTLPQNGDFLEEKCWHMARALKSFQFEGPVVVTYRQGNPRWTFFATKTSRGACSQSNQHQQIR
jgi:hypothetical protein